MFILPKLFEYLSSSMENMAQFVCDRAILSPCDIVCRGKECTAVSGFHKTAREQCLDKVLSFLSQEIESEDE